VGLEYLFTRRDSNFNAFDFDEHLVTGRVTLQFWPASRLDQPPGLAHTVGAL